MEVREQQKISLKTRSLTVVRRLGKGKSGHSWLAEDDRSKFVLKIMHEEPCAYYKFGDKLEAELRAYARLSALMPLPRITA